MRFDLQGSTSQNNVIQAALNRCTFPFADKATDRVIPVLWSDLSAWGSVRASGDHDHAHEGDVVGHPVYDEARRRVLGLAWTSGKIELDLSCEADALLGQEVFLAEAAHMVDFFVLTPEQRRAVYDTLHSSLSADQLDQHRLEHGWWEEAADDSYWALVGEAFMAAWTMAYSDLVPWQASFAHQATPEVATRIRAILTPASPPPPPPPPPAPTYFATRTGKTFHDTHARLEPARTFDTRAAALAAGLRPCRTCRP